MKINNKKGICYWITGLSGAGKTTILKMLCGLIYPSEGYVSVSGYKPYERKAEFLKQISLIKIKCQNS